MQGEFLKLTKLTKTPEKNIEFFSGVSLLRSNVIEEILGFAKRGKPKFT